MKQTQHINAHIQLKMIQVLEQKNIRAEVLFSMVVVDNEIVPMFVISDDMPDGISEELYNLFDKHLGFKNIKKMSSELLKNKDFVKAFNRK